MSTIGKVDSLWRYPVKSMRGEALSEAFVGFAGVYGDRLYAFKSASRPKGFPYLTGREQPKMIRYRPRFRNSGQAAAPPNLTEAQGIAPGLNPVFADAQDLVVDVETPDGEVMAIDDPKLICELGEGLRGGSAIGLSRSDRGHTDCRPISLFSIQTARRLGEELGLEIDQRRFRANIYLDLSSTSGFAEDRLVGRTLRVGSKAVLAVLERDPRCAMITLDPETAARNPDILGTVTKNHEGKAGIYAAVLVEGMVRVGDGLAVID